MPESPFVKKYPRKRLTWQNELDLSPLAELPHLEGLQLSGDLKALDLGFLSKMPALKKLVVPEDCQLPETLKKDVQVLRE